MEKKEVVIGSDGTKVDVFDIEGIECYEKDGVAYLKLENVARGLGFTKTEIKNGNEYTTIRWKRVGGYLEEIGFDHEWSKDDFIPENIFYRLSMKASNETAIKFQTVIADEVLPKLRKYGMYITNDKLEEIMNDPDAWIIMLSEYKKEKEGRIKAEQLIEEQKPKVEAYDELMNDPGLLSINDVAKEVGIGEYKLFEFLRQHSVLFYNQDKFNIPYERFRKEGKFVVKEKQQNGRYYPTTYATPKGLDYIRKLLKKYNPFEEVA